MVLFYAKFPTPFHGIKKNSKEIGYNRATGKRFIRSNDRAKFVENWLIQKLTVEKLKQRLDTIEHDISAKFTFYFPESVYYTKKNVRSQKVPDLSNLFESIQDALQKAKVITNDSMIVSLDGSRREPINDNTTWLEIELTKAT